MSEQKAPNSSRSKDGLGIIWIGLCLIVGAAIAFTATAFDALTSFGNATPTRSLIVFLVCWPIGALLCYTAIKDLKEQLARRRTTPREVRSFNEPVVLVWVGAIMISGLLYLLLGDFP